LYNNAVSKRKYSFLILDKVNFDKYESRYRTTIQYKRYTKEYREKLENYIINNEKTNIYLKDKNNKEG